MNKVICNNHFLLGSASPRRLDLLNQIGIDPDLVISPNIDEINLRKELPLDYVKRMAIEKNLIHLNNQDIEEILKKRYEKIMSYGLV